MTMDTDELTKAAAAAAIGALTKVAAEPALGAGRRVWDWLKLKLGGKGAPAVAEVEADPSKRSAPAKVTALLQDLLDADPIFAGELRRILEEGGGVQAITQSANVQGDNNTTAQTAGSGNTVTLGR